MLIIPAIDIKGGKCVRLIHGKIEYETVFSNNPSEVAKLWEKDGAELIHVVDLDRAISGDNGNFNIIRKIVNTVNIPIQVGGGIRSHDDIKRYLNSGIKRVVIGTMAYKDRDFVVKACKLFPESILVSVDAQDNRIAIKGWSELTNVNYIEIAKTFEGIGLVSLIFTDIDRDGTLKGPNIKNIKIFSKNVNIPLIVSGGISSFNDIIKIIRLKEKLITGLIVGKALYTRQIDLKTAIKIGREQDVNKKGNSLP